VEALEREDEAEDAEMLEFEESGETDYYAWLDKRKESKS